MEGLNNKLEIGSLAMIINCEKESSRKWIGTIVTVEEFVQNRHPVTEHFVNPYKMVVARGAAVRVSGYQGTPCIIDELNPPVYAKSGVGFFKASCLMPLPPLSEEELNKESELCYDH